MSKTSVIIPAAGVGKRMGGLRKILLEIGGRPVILHTLNTFEHHPMVESIVLVVRSGEVEEARELVRRHGFRKVKNIVEGGTERQDSVWNGLQAVDNDTDVVLVHDGVRPFVSDDMIRDVIEEASRGHGAVPAVPVKDTIKQVDAGGRVVETPDRRNLVAVQTPQGFPLAMLRRAFHAAMKDGFCGTDEAALVERIREEVRVVPGSYDNIKITTPEDVSLAGAILSRTSCPDPTP